MAADYATFLQEIPWYKYDFDAWHAKLMAAQTDGLRSYERRIALGIEWKAKAAYARVIAKAAGAVGADELTMRVALRGIDASALAAFANVTPISESDGIVIAEVPRYRSFTKLATQLLQGESNAQFVEIAGNDDVLVSLYSGPNPADLEVGDLISTTLRPGFDTAKRRLVALKITDLRRLLSTLKQDRLEHIYDY